MYSILFVSVNVNCEIFHCIVGARLQLNPAWKNPTGEWHSGYKLAYELFTETLVSRLKVVMSSSYVLSFVLHA